MKECDIVFESGRHWVYAKNAKLGQYEVYKAGNTYSVRVACISNSIDPAWALDRAIAECAKRAGK